MGTLFTFGHLAGAGLFILALPLLALFVGPAVLRWVWNLTLPELFSLPQIRYWQAFRVLVVALLLFGLPRLL